MANKKNEFVLPAISKPVESKGYTYRKTGKNGRKKDIATYSLDPTLADKIERWAYETRKTQSEIVETILRSALDGRDFPPIPSEKPIEL